MFSLEPLTLPDIDARSLVDVAARTGFDYLSMVLHQPAPSLRADAIVQDRELRSETAAAMKSQGIRLLNIECFNLTADAAPSDFCAGLACGHELGARTASAIVWENSDRADVLAKFRRLCDMAREMNIHVNVEFFAFSQSMPTLQAAVDLVRDSGRENAGVVIDLLHLIRTGSSVEQLRRLEPSLIGAAQLCDGFLEIDSSALLAEAGGNRKAPGDGEFPIAAFVEAIPPEIVIGLEVPQVALIGSVTPQERARNLLATTRRILD